MTPGLTPADPIPLAARTRTPSASRPSSNFDPRSSPSPSPSTSASAPASASSSASVTFRPPASSSIPIPIPITATSSTLPFPVPLPLPLPLSVALPLPLQLPFPSDGPNLGFVTPSCSPPSGSALRPPLGSPHAVGRARLDMFDILFLIGQGGFGKVFLVRHKATSAVYAMKVMEKAALIQRKAVGDAHAERNLLAMLGRVDAPFVVRLHVAFQTGRRVYLVMDFAAGGELMFHLRRDALLSESDARFYAAELLIALETLHDCDVIHRDIKPENVLIDTEGHLVLTDFGLAKQLSSSSKHSEAGAQEEAMEHSWCGSEDYMAPEIIARRAHSGKPADFWAYGVFIYDCLCGHPPFSPPHEKGKTNRRRLHDRILKVKPKLPPFLSPQCHHLLRGLLTKDVGKRLKDPEAIKKHPWFKDVDWDRVRNRMESPPFIPPCSSPTACFSPSLTKTQISAPQSPMVTTTAATTTSSGSSAAINIPGRIGSVGNNSNGHGGGGNPWQGFSFVAPGMEVHFELAPSAANVIAEVEKEKEGVFGGGLAGSPTFLNVNMTSGVDHAEINRKLANARKCAEEIISHGCNHAQQARDLGEVDEELAADLAEFSVDAKEAVEMFEE